ncbi:hypothetical protein FQA39_LY07397 [Lamprigera yunnana]|nr:hypothetical protein FQA39_LY07397 [Lamprigera yunnana]
MQGLRDVLRKEFNKVSKGRRSGDEAPLEKEMHYADESTNDAPMQQASSSQMSLDIVEENSQTSAGPAKLKGLVSHKSIKKIN